MIVLASTSPHRRGLLARIGVPFEVASPSFDEDAMAPLFAELDDADFALTLARGKADSVAHQNPDRWILAADQVATLRGPPRELLRKPGSEEAAIQQLMQLRGRTHHLTTAVVLMHKERGESRTAIDRQALTMRQSSRAEVEAYVAEYKPLDCVGSYRIEDAGIRFFERIQGDDYTGIIGLPLLAVCRLLRSVGLGG